MKGEVSKSEDACLTHLGVSQVKVSKPGSPCAVLPTLSIPDDPVERVQANKRDAHKVFDAGASTATRSLARTRPHAETPHAPLPPVPFTPSQGVRTPGSVPITKQMFTPFSSSTVHAEVQNHMAQTSSSAPHRSNSSRSVGPAPSPAAHSATSNQPHSEATSDYSHATHMAHMQTHMPYQPYMMYPLGSMAYPDAGSSPMRPPSPLMGSPVSTPTASYMFPQTPFAGAHHSPFSQFHSSSFTGPGHGYGHGGEPSMSPQNSGHYSYFHPLFNNFPPFMGLQSMGSMQGPGAHLPLQTMRSNSSSAVLQVGGAGFGQAGIGGERGGPGGGGPGAARGPPEGTQHPPAV
ncbi:hypothetical protein V8C86DRAFT_1296109 [Haematococcus lacustris]